MSNRTRLTPFPLSLTVEREISEGTETSRGFVSGSLSASGFGERFVMHRQSTDRHYPTATI
jgi:hypothetical protein